MEENKVKRQWRAEQDIHAGRWLIFENEIMVALAFGGKVAPLITASPIMYEALLTAKAVIASIPNEIEALRQIQQAINQAEGTE